VFDYVAGKLDWLAAGLPAEGTNAQRPRAGDVARKDVPTCHLAERVGDVAERVAAGGWDACVVVNQERVVLGLLRAKELQSDPDLRVEEAMRPGPSTFRPFVSIEQMAKTMTEHDLVRGDVNEKTVGPPTCTHCGELIECCELCDEPACSAPICYECSNVELGQSQAQPHVHGG
jgi:hypothetical protein